MKSNELKKQQERRSAAVAELTRFAKWLNLGNGALKLRGALSPRRALEHLKNQNVRDLLGKERANEVRKAAELLS